MDECLAGEYICDVNAICVNTIGSYSCQCLPPYFGDGGTCSRKHQIIVSYILYKIMLNLQGTACIYSHAIQDIYALSVCNCCKLLEINFF